MKIAFCIARKIDLPQISRDPCAERLPKAMRLVALASAVVMAAAMDMPPRARKQPMRAPAGTHHKQAHSIHSITTQRISHGVTQKSRFSAYSLCNTVHFTPREMTCETQTDTITAAHVSQQRVK